MAEGSSEAKVLIVPGLGGSGPKHGQSIWQARNPGYRRVEQRDRDEPDLEGGYLAWRPPCARRSLQ